METLELQERRRTGKGDRNRFRNPGQTSTGGEEMTRAIVNLVRELSGNKGKDRLGRVKVFEERRSLEKKKKVTENGNFGEYAEQTQRRWGHRGYEKTQGKKEEDRLVRKA